METAIAWSKKLHKPMFILLFNLPISDMYVMYDVSCKVKCMWTRGEVTWLYLGFNLSLMVEGGAAAKPGSDAASQDTLYGSPVEAAECPGVHVEPPQPAADEE
ncbi:hypothetical protein L3Q82_004906 [Scortum barcoo]|uniref:Uncharacterized protein n=1 Tax=Scortum barcoo TaxID=214431 RepID=A0ACB8VDD1_9TELE|nr:hypothetical protein L3Q82_004906 [Scortum barcoo]